MENIKTNVKKFSPIMEKERKVIFFTREQLRTLILRLDESGANEIGVEFREK